MNIKSTVTRGLIYLALNYLDAHVYLHRYTNITELINQDLFRILFSYNNLYWNELYRCYIRNQIILILPIISKK